MSTAYAFCLCIKFYFQLAGYLLDEEYKEVQEKAQSILNNGQAITYVTGNYTNISQFFFSIKKFSFSFIFYN